MKSTGKRVAVITPYYQEKTEVLEKCHLSVLAQKVDATHFMIADGHPKSVVDEWNVVHTRLHKSHGDNGNTPRAIGGFLAQSEGFDYLAYLDADNWFHDGHLDSLIELQVREEAHVCCSMRTFHDLNGTEMVGLKDPIDENRSHVDTSCYLIHKSAFSYCLPIWVNMPRQLSPVCDKIFFTGLKHFRLRISHSGLRTVAFRSQYPFHYQLSGFPVPENSKFAVTVEPKTWLLSLEGVKECIERLGFYPLSE